MSEVVPPEERVCERCGRMDVWSEREQKWVVAESDGEPQHGQPHCLHEWDINGAYNPFSK
ncbi:HEWD family protein [Salinibaculum rarum]|uniref:HEWD family protein n=1 Tax=Salinibaculum rarum TaxID=3058903 RepID=UPI00265FE1B8|nr:HEWD family protein [Salinibaculum sp. KK48]